MSTETDARAEAREYKKDLTVMETELGLLMELAVEHFLVSSLR